MVKQRISLGLVLLTATSMFAAANCDNGDTVVSVNVSYDSTAMDVQMNVAKLHIVISPKSGGGSAVITDIDITRDSDGGITNAVYKRVIVNGLSGTVDVTVDALDMGGKPLLSASVTENLVQHGAVAAFVKFTRMMPDAGTMGTGGSEGSGGMTGSGGETGTGGTSASGGETGSGGTPGAAGGGGAGGGHGGAGENGGANGTGGVLGISIGSGGTKGSGGGTGSGGAGSGGNHGTGGA